MPLYNRLIDKVNEEEERPLGTKEFGIADTLESVGSFISDQYKRIPEESRTELKRQLSIGLQPERWPDGTEKPNTLKILGNVYNKTIQPVKDEVSRVTGVSPREIDAVELTFDAVTAGIPLSKKALKSVISIIDTSPFKVANPKNLPQFVGGTGTGFGPKSSDSDYNWVNIKGSSLHPGGPTGKFPAGKGRELSSELITGIEVTKEVKDRFKKAGMDANKLIEERLGIALGTPEIHHKSLLRQLWESMNGLDEVHVTKSKRYYQRELGFKLGDAISNAGPVPKIFHPMIHAVMNKRLGGSAGSWSLKGLEKKFGLAKDWKKTTKFPQRMPVYDEIIDTVRDSIKDVETLWNAIESRTVLLGNLPEDHFIKSTLDLVNLDDKILASGKIGMMRQVPGVETATDVANYLLEKAGKVDLSLPTFRNLNPFDLEVVAKLEIVNEKILREALLTKQSPATIYRAYKLKDLLNIELNQFKDLLQLLDPDDLIKTGMSIEDVDTFLRTGTADPRKAKSSLIPIDTPPRTDYTIKQLKDMGRTPAEIQEYIDAGWVKLDYDDLFPDR